MVSGIFLLVGPFGDHHILVDRRGEEWSREEFHRVCEEICARKDVNFTKLLRILDREYGLIEVDPRELNGYFNYRDEVGYT